MRHLKNLALRKAALLTAIMVALMVAAVDAMSFFVLAEGRPGTLSALLTLGGGIVVGAVIWNALRRPSRVP